eukprot:COSAG05_NODE_8955_length_658_cov_1.182469_2_plen_82_part_01
MESAWLPKDHSHSFSTGTSTGTSTSTGGVPRGWSVGSRTATAHAVLRSVEHYKLPRYRDLAPVFFFLGIFGMGIGIGFGIGM